MPSGGPIPINNSGRKKPEAVAPAPGLFLWRYDGRRVPEKNNFTFCLSLGPSTALHPPARISIRAGGCALSTNPNSAPSCGIMSYRDPYLAALRASASHPFHLSLFFAIHAST